MTLFPGVIDNPRGYVGIVYGHPSGVLWQCHVIGHDHRGVAEQHAMDEIRRLIVAEFATLDPQHRRVWRLDVTYPEGSLEPGWTPANWPDEHITGRARRKAIRAGFRWPHNRPYITPSGAYHRKDLLERWGAKVAVVRSNPVTWPHQGPVA